MCSSYGMLKSVVDSTPSLQKSSAGTGLMHESFDADNVGSLTRSWFAWANSLFGQAILHVADTRPGLIMNWSA